MKKLFSILRTIFTGSSAPVRLPQDADIQTYRTRPPEALIKRINRNGDLNAPGTPHPLLTLEEFFEGNGDYGSIGYNFYPDQPAPLEFYEHFRSIRQRPDVADVLVEVKDREDAEGWPSTDTIWIVTDKSVNDVRQWLGERFAADDFLEGWDGGPPKEPYAVPDGMRPIGVWWD